MTRYRFRLETVRRVRRVQEDLAIGAWRLAQGELRAADVALEAATDRYRSRSLPIGVMRANDLIAQHEEMSRAADFVVSSQVRRAAASSKVDDRRADWSVAAQRVAGLDKLDERARTDHTLAAHRSEAVIDDDRAAVAFRTRHELQKGSR